MVRACAAVVVSLMVLAGIVGSLRAAPVASPSPPANPACDWAETIYPPTTSYEVLEHRVFRRVNGRLVDPNLFPAAEFAPDGTQIMPRGYVARTPDRFDYITFRQDRHTPPPDLGNPRSLSGRLFWTDHGDLLNLGGPDMVRGLEGAVMRWDRRNLRDFHTESTQREAGIVGLAAALEGVIERHPELFLPHSVRRAADVAVTRLEGDSGGLERTTWTDRGHRFEVDTLSDADGTCRVIAVKVRRTGPRGVNLEVRATEFARTSTGRQAWTAATGHADFTGSEGVVEYRNYVVRRSVPVDVRDAMDPRLFHFVVPENYGLVDEALPIVRHRFEGDDLVAERDAVAPALIEQAIATGVLTEEHPLRGPFCGVQALYAAARMLAVDADYNTLIDARYVGSQGSSAAQLVAAAQTLGLQTRVLQATPRTEVLRLRPPALLHVRKHPSTPSPDHWVLFMGAQDGKARIFDAIMTPALRSLSEVAAVWEGTAIEVAPAGRPFGSGETPLKSARQGLPLVVLIVGAAALAVGLSFAASGLLLRAGGASRWTLVSLPLAIGAAAGVAAVSVDLLRPDSMLRSPQLLQTLDLDSRLYQVRVITAKQLRQLRSDTPPLEFDVAQLKRMPDPSRVTLVADHTGRRPVVLLATSRADAGAAAGVARKLLQAGHREVMVSHAFSPRE